MDADTQVRILSIAGFLLEVGGILYGLTGFKGITALPMRGARRFFPRGAPRTHDASFRSDGVATSEFEATVKRAEPTDIPAVVAWVKRELQELGQAMREQRRTTAAELADAERRVQDSARSEDQQTRGILQITEARARGAAFMIGVGAMCSAAANLAGTGLF